ncbi:MAG TPA: tetratricopeptide repeat protein, partial [Anaerolineales bacterium]|nr:tetratricopeptide repeat protein [Anaerolineales bacterium]
FKKHYDIAHEISNHLSELSALENLGATYTQMGDYYKAVDAYEQAATISQEIGNREAELMHIRRIGEAYAMIGNLDVIPNAIEVNERQLALSREIKDSDAEAAALAMLGFLNYNIGEKEKGIMLTKQALEIFRAIGAPASTVDALRNMLRQWGVSN